MEDNDAQQQLKKRARRRLVGAVFFASVAAIVLPMVMDHEPRPSLTDVEIRIPGQDEKPFVPAVAPPEAAPVAVAPPAAPVPQAPPPVEDKPAIPAEKPPVPDKPAAPEKPAPRPAAAAADDEAKRAAAILAGGSAGTPSAERPQGRQEYLVLIGAFSDPANVTILKKKLGELGIKTFTEPLDTPQGRKTRVRAGPFPNRDAAEKALERMKRIGVTGVVAAKP